MAREPRMAFYIFKWLGGVSKEEGDFVIHENVYEIQIFEYYK